MTGQIIDESDDQRQELVDEDPKNDEETKLEDKVINSYTSDENSSCENNKLLENEVFDSEANFQDIEFINKVIGIDSKPDELQIPPESKTFEAPPMNVEEAMQKLFCDDEKTDYPSSSVPEDVSFNQ